MIIAIGDFVLIVDLSLVLFVFEHEMFSNSQLAEPLRNDVQCEKCGAFGTNDISLFLFVFQRAMRNDRQRACTAPQMIPDRK